MQEHTYGFFGVLCIKSSPSFVPIANLDYVETMSLIGSGLSILVPST